MKLKKVAALCAKVGAFYLFDELEEGGELIRQWLGDGRGSNRDYPSAAGKCAVKPWRWSYSQRTKACKKYYKDRRSEK